MSSGQNERKNEEEMKRMRYNVNKIKRSKNKEIRERENAPKIYTCST